MAIWLWGQLMLIESVLWLSAPCLDLWLTPVTPVTSVPSTSVSVFLEEDGEGAAGFPGGGGLMHEECLLKELRDGWLNL